jgi:hypothetical protein
VSTGFLQSMTVLLLSAPHRPAMGSLNPPFAFHHRMPDQLLRAIAAGMTADSWRRDFAKMQAMGN